tara:strand:+ start:356 stop:562 length:207 start_codon:yes stop_codon:yes gene_type:complete
MKISKARLKQIIMEEIKKFMIVEQEDKEAEENKEEAVEDLIDKSKTKTNPEDEASALRAAADVAATKK